MDKHQSVSRTVQTLQTAYPLLNNCCIETDTTIAYNISTYSITDSIKDLMIYSLEKIDSVPEGNCPITYLVGLVVEKIPYKTFLYCTAKGFGTDYFYHYGFLPNKLPHPVVGLKK